MIVVTVKHEDFNENEVETSFHFHLSKKNMLVLQKKLGGDIESRVKTMVEAGDALGLIEMFEEVMVLAVGKKSEDGKSFVQNDDIREWFRGHSGFEACLEKIIESEDSAKSFIQGIIPKDVRLKLAQDELQPTLLKMN